MKEGSKEAPNAPRGKDTGNGYPYDPRATGTKCFRARAQSIFMKMILKIHPPTHTPPPGNGKPLDNQA